MQEENEKVIMKFEDANNNIETFETKLSEFGNGDKAYICPLCSQLRQLRQGCVSGHIAITPIGRPQKISGGYAKTGLKKKNFMRLTDQEKMLIEKIREDRDREYCEWNHKMHIHVKIPSCESHLMEYDPECKTEKLPMIFRDIYWDEIADNMNIN